MLLRHELSELGAVCLQTMVCTCQPVCPLATVGCCHASVTDIIGYHDVHHQYCYHVGQSLLPQKGPAEGSAQLLGYAQTLQVCEWEL